MTRKADKKDSGSQIEFVDASNQLHFLDVSDSQNDSVKNISTDLLNKNPASKQIKYINNSLECEVTLVSESFPELHLKDNVKPQYVPKLKSRINPLKSFYQKYVEGIQRSLNAIDLDDLKDFVDDLIKVRESGNTIYIFGNGGSAATASHFANDFSKNRFKQKDLLFKVVCLNDCVPLMTALANDCGYDQVFAAQLENLVVPGDLVIGISSSGNSPNIVNAFDVANKNGARTWAWVGFEGGKAMEKANRSVYMLSKKGQYGFMEDVSMILNHAVCIFIEEQDKKILAKKKSSL